MIKPEKASSNLLVVFGGVEYGSLSSNQTSAGTKSEKNKFSQLNMQAAKELKGMKYLPDSLAEANTIADIFKTNAKDGKALIYEKLEATEHKLKSLSKPPRILHLSTHGFYLQDAELTGWADEAPLLLSGLALAGASQGLQGKVDGNGDDGLLYSIEVLGLNLQGTELVSLSACDTGKGVIDYSEGVYGLVRAFHTAGAKSVLMTLRPVGDKTSRIFMETFYENWLASEDNPTPSEALHRTQLYFINHPIVIRLYGPPMCWWYVRTVKQ